MSDEAPPQTAGEPRLDQPFEATLSASQAPAIDDADDLRGFHFRRLLGKPLTWILSGILVVAAAVAGAVVVGAAGAALGLVGAVAIALLCLFLIADSASEEAFFGTYAEQRGMARQEKGQLPAVTPLLRKGDERKAEEILRGSLGDGVDGTLALYTYTDVYHDKNGRHESDYHFTVAMTDLPDCLEFVPELFCNRKSGFRFMESIEDVFRNKERLHLESEALAEDYEIFVSKKQDPNWIRQLFSPTFIVWLTESAPEKFAFELDCGVLCCNVKGHKKDATHLDAMRTATTAVARRIREEVGE